MAITEVSSQSWFSRLGKSFSGILGGLAVFVLAIILLAWNEGRAVKTAKGLEEGAASVSSLERADRVNPEYDGKLVHLTGMATSEEVLKDDIFEIEVPALKLRRDVEMLQWKEIAETSTRNKLGGGTETITTYKYEKIWSDTWIDSSGFKQPKEHQNPPGMELESSEKQAANIKVGAFHLSDGLINSLRKYEAVEPPANLPEGYLVKGGTIYRTADLATPQIGDVSVTFKAAMPQQISVVALQKGDGLEAYRTRMGTQIQMLHYGDVSAASMFDSAKSANKTLTWGLRLLGFILLFIAAKTMLAPIGVLADVLPFAGKIARFGTSVIAAIVALPVGLITVAIAWVAYRPALAITLLVIAIAIPAALLLMRKKSSPPAHA